MDDSVTTTELETEVAEVGGCLIDDVKSCEIRWMRNGLGTAWVNCPLEAANKIAENGKLKVDEQLQRPNYSKNGHCNALIVGPSAT